MKILALSRWFPWPPNNGARIRAANLLTYLAKNHTIDLISFVVPGSEINMEQGQIVCQEVQVIPYSAFQPGGWKALYGLFSRWPRSVFSTQNDAIRQAIITLIQDQYYDAVIAFGVDMAPYVLEIPRSKADIRILEEVELTTLYEQHARARHTLQRFRYSLMWKKWINYINHLMVNFDGFTTVSKPELEIVNGALRGGSIQIENEIIPNGIAVNYYRGDFGTPVPDTLIYSGALSYDANFDAVDFFLRKIWPLVLKQRPQTIFSITGKISDSQIKQLPALPNVIFTGYLPDIRPAIAQSWINIVPLRIGGGTRLKILESLALHTPVISTTKGAEGLRLIPNQDILISDHPEKFTQHILNLLDTPNLRRQLSQRGYQAILKYDWNINGQILNEFIDKISASRKLTNF